MTTLELATQQLMAAVSSALDQPIELDASGQCALAFDPDIELVIAHASHDDAISVRVALGDGAGLSAQALRGALAVNYGRLRPGHGIAYDEVSRQLVVFVLLRASTIVPEDFIGLLADLVALIPDLRTELALTANATTTLRDSSPLGAIFA